MLNDLQANERKRIEIRIDSVPLSGRSVSDVRPLHLHFKIHRLNRVNPVHEA